MKYFFFPILWFAFFVSRAQIPDHIYKPNIRSVTLTKAGDIYSYPVMNLNSGDAFELHFDDLDGDVKTYYYTFVLCNADWTPTTLTPFDYIRGFQNVRISNYRTSSIAFTRYTHYQVFFPDRNCMPTRSGNYMLKV
ncbi:MAG TPA: type IX secretion system plug protein domain-containing protein, partial [Chitinophagaceae bacterium]|nr:type IX secretion system plug protein domain-containing protein [Chitinophagaceae bacterium]